MKRRCLALTAHFALVLTLALASNAAAATYVVDRYDDPSISDTCDAAPNNCSLRQAINIAKLTPDSTVSIPAGTFTLSLGSAGDELNAAGDLDVQAGMTIAGAGPALTKIVANARYDRVFDFWLAPGDSASLTGVTVTGGGGVSDGAGIRQQTGGTISIGNSVVTDNVGTGGAGGGVSSFQGTLNVDRTTVSYNTATSGIGGGFFLNDPGGTLNITNSTIIGNSAVGDDGGGIHSQGHLTLVNSTVSGNTTTGSGGGVSAAGGADAKVTNVTIAGNSGGTGGGIYAGSSSYEIENSIVAGNTASAGEVNCRLYGGGAITSKGHNIEDASTCGFAAAGDLPGTNPLLNPLANNGGPTQTLSLQRGSPAIRAGNAATCPAADQRGVARTGGCDIGAFQFDDVTAPSLTKLKLRPSSFRARKSGGSVVSRGRSAGGTKVRFTISEAAAVMFTVERIVKGHKRGKQCSTKRRRGKRCTIYKTRPGSFTVQAAQGANSFKFSGRLKGRKLAPGNYRLVATPTDASTNTGKAVRKKFKIVR